MYTMHTMHTMGLKTPEFTVKNDPCGKNQSYKWPKNNGCNGSPTKNTLFPGDILDRFGSENGIFFGYPNDYYIHRSLPYFGIYQEDKPNCINKMINSYHNFYKTNTDQYNQYMFKKEYEMNVCNIAKAFGYPGGGTQYWSDKTVKQLLDQGIIEKVTNINHIPFFDEIDEYNFKNRSYKNGGKRKRLTLRNKNKFCKYTRKNKIQSRRYKKR